jgi:hypothetical protein
VGLVIGMAGCSGGQPSSTARSEPPPATAGESASASTRALEGEELVTALVAYGADHADEFAGLYVDPPGSDRFVVLFTDHLDEHRAALAALSPKVSVGGADYTEAELTRLLESLDLSGMATDDLEPISAGLDTVGNRVYLELKSNDPTLELRLELEYGGMVEVTVYPIPGPWENATEGEGWRLLGAGESSGEEAYVVHAATDEAEYADLWASLGTAGEAPEVDFAEEVVVSFGHGVGSSCPELRLDGVRIDGDLVSSAVSDPLAPRACTSDLVGAVVFVVALERSALPDDGFTLVLDAQSLDCCGDLDELDVPLP